MSSVARYSAAQRKGTFTSIMNIWKALSGGEIGGSQCCDNGKWRVRWHPHCRGVKDTDSVGRLRRSAREIKRGFGFA